MTGAALQIYEFDISVDSTQMVHIEPLNVGQVMTYRVTGTGNDRVVYVEFEDAVWMFGSGAHVALAESDGARVVCLEAVGIGPVGARIVGGGIRTTLERGRVWTKP